MYYIVFFIYWNGYMEILGSKTEGFKLAQQSKEQAVRYSLIFMEEKDRSLGTSSLNVRTH